MESYEKDWKKDLKELKNLLSEDREPKPIIFIGGREGCKMMEEAFEREIERRGIKIKDRN